MLNQEIADLLIKQKKPEEVLDMVLETITSAQCLLRPSDENVSLEYTAGQALEKLELAHQTLRALRYKQYGQKPPMVI